MNQEKRVNKKSGKTFPGGIGFAVDFDSTVRFHGGPLMSLFVGKRSAVFVL
jgi:hypothetical protein